MPISWIDADGKSGVAENAYEYAMQRGSPGQSGELGTPGQSGETGIPGQSGTADIGPKQTPDEGDTVRPGESKIGDYLATFDEHLGTAFDYLKQFYKGGLHEVAKKRGAELPAWSDKMAEFFQREDVNLVLGSANVPGIKGAKTTRLWRGETDFPNEAKRPLSEWMQDAMKHDPALKGMQEATGRWFNSDKASAEYYNKTFGDKSGRVSYVDVLTSELENYRVSNMSKEIQGFSARPTEEFFLPKDIAQKRLMETIQQQQQAGGWLTSMPHVQEKFKSLVESNASMKEIQFQTGLSTNTIRKLEEITGSTIERKPGGTVWTPDKTKELESLVKNSELSQQGIADHLGVHLNTVRKKISDLDLATTRGYKPIPSEEVTKFKELAAEGKTASQIATALDRPYETIAWLKRRHGVETAVDTSNKGRPSKIENDEKMLALRKEGKSFAEIADELGVSRSAVAGKLSRLKKLQVTDEHAMSEEDIKHFTAMNKLSSSINQDAFDKWLDSRPESLEIDDRTKLRDFFNEWYHAHKDQAMSDLVEVPGGWQKNPGPAEGGRLANELGAKELAPKTKRKNK